jgi:hypothetical protein
MVDLGKVNSIDNLIAIRRELAEALRMIDESITAYNRSRRRRREFKVSLTEALGGCPH